ncbi:hypothetical protein [Parachitinimonas caeni]|uniref:Uncharacterized protein n=1 Tax=Parachitinimonas caeni TaxID=3031301 RepID=A0ABT7DWY4_9NEIS|nr:hypothetical protein [Parachitinimonas caeni]MDK2124576.1 hypothetical protein [Parachitinimonas caeni]
MKKLTPSKKNEFPMNARPEWAISLIGFFGSTAVALLFGGMLTGNTCLFIKLGVGALGITFILFGVFALCFSWTFPIQYSHKSSSRKTDPLFWYTICLGSILTGVMCLMPALGLTAEMAKMCG